LSRRPWETALSKVYSGRENPKTRGNSIEKIAGGDGKHGGYALVARVGGSQLSVVRQGERWKKRGEEKGILSAGIATFTVVRLRDMWKDVNVDGCKRKWGGSSANLWRIE